MEKTMEILMETLKLLTWPNSLTSIKQEKKHDEYAKALIYLCIYFSSSLYADQ